MIRKASLVGEQLVFPLEWREGLCLCLCSSRSVVRGPAPRPQGPTKGGFRWTLPSLLCLTLHVLHGLPDARARRVHGAGGRPRCYRGSGRGSGSASLLPPESTVHAGAGVANSTPLLEGHKATTGSQALRRHRLHTPRPPTSSCSVASGDCRSQCFSACSVSQTSEITKRIFWTHVDLSIYYFAKHNEKRWLSPFPFTPIP